MVAPRRPIALDLCRLPSLLGPREHSAGSGLVERLVLDKPHKERQQNVVALVGGQELYQHNLHRLTGLCTLLLRYTARHDTTIISQYRAGHLLGLGSREREVCTMRENSGSTRAKSTHGRLPNRQSRSLNASLTSPCETGRSPLSSACGFVFKFIYLGPQTEFWT